MADIVERLRARAFRAGTGQAVTLLDAGDIARLNKEAADEIERLRGESAGSNQLVKAGEKIDQLTSELAERDKTIVAMREAINNVVSDDCDAVIHPVCWQRLKNTLTLTPDDLADMVLVKREDSHD